MEISNGMKGCVVIPTFNEAKIISELIVSIKKFGLDVLVVDDGSKDGTSLLAKEAGAEVISHQRNMGKGASLRAGFNRAIGKDYDFIITMDGDGQHLSQDLEVFLNRFSLGNSDIIVGNRMNDTSRMPFLRKITNKYMSSLISSICQSNIPDTQCGFRLIKKEVLNDIILSSSNYEIESELLIQAAKKKYKIESVDIKTIYDGQKSQINPTIDTFRFFKFLLKDRVREGRLILKEIFSDVIIKHSSLIFVSSVITNIFNLLFWLFMVRNLSHIDYGILNSIVSFIVLASMPVGILQTALIKYFSEFNALEKQNEFKVLFYAFLKRGMAVFLLTVIIIFLSSNKLSQFLKISNPIFIYSTGVYLFFSALLTLTMSSMQSLHLFKSIAVNSIFQIFVKFFSGITLVLLGFKAFGAFSAFLIASLFSLILSIFQLPKWVFDLRNVDYHFVKKIINLKNIYEYCIPVGLGMVAFNIFSNSDVILVKHFFSEGEAGIYSIAQTVGKMILFFPGAISLVLFPVAVNYKTRNKQTLPLLKKSLFYVGILCFAGAVFTFSFPDLIIRLITGRDVKEAVSLVKFFIIPMSFFAMIQILIYYHLSLNNLKYLILLFVMSIIQVGLIYFFHNSLLQILLVLTAVSSIAFFFGIKQLITSKE